MSNYPQHISSRGKPADCHAQPGNCPLKHFATVAEANNAILLENAGINIELPPSSKFPADPTNKAEVYIQALEYAKTDLWSSKFREEEKEYAQAFYNAYVNKETEHVYKRKNMYDLTKEEMTAEAVASGKARASYLLKLEKEDVKFLDGNLSYFGKEEYPFAKYHMLKNPFKNGQKVVIPAGTRYKNDKGEMVETKRKISIIVDFTNKGYVDGSVWKRFANPPVISGKSRRYYAVTPEILKANALPVTETFQTGMLGLANNREI